LIFLIGCSTNFRQPGNERPPSWQAREPVKPPPIPPAPPVVPAPVPTPAPQPPAPPEELLNTWVSLDRWGQQRGFGAARRLSSAPVVTYGMATTNGVLVVCIGSLSAFWDGLEFHLGFAPQQIDGQVFLHALDLRKNLDPLLRGFQPISKTNRVIVIDAGHGGKESGAKSVLNDHYEKEFTLDWASRLAGLLRTNGWRVFLTRTNDTDVSLSNRVAFAEAHQADLFISLHFNSQAPDEKESGLETYCLTPTGMPSTFTHGYADIVTQVYPNNAFDAQNLQYAFRVHRALLKVNGLADRGVRRARFMGVLRGQHRPAVLIEGGYLSNPREARLIADPAYRQKLAEAVAKALND
jgi:N-acetylmuramoyl-L-alanine amidase